MNRNLLRLLALLLAFALVAAACGDDDDETGGDDTVATDDAAADDGETADDAAVDDAAADDGEMTDDDAAADDAAADDGEMTDDDGAADDAAADDGMVDEGVLAGVCPDTIVVQKDWNPEAEHGMLYELVGKTGYEIDASAATVRGDLVAAGVDTGVDIEVRSGGPAIGFQQVTAQMYQDDAITMGYVSTDEAIENAAEFPTVSFLAPLEINPQMIMWDPETYPDVESIADLKDGGATIRYFGTATYMPDLVARGIVDEAQLDGSYDGTPAVFVAEGGSIAQQGFASAEPYIYENEIEDWGKPVRFELIHDVGLQAYAAAIGTKPDTFQELKDSGCLELLVPIMQQAQVDYITNPDASNTLILELVEAYDNGWVYSQGVADFSVQQQLDLGLVGNGPDDTLGNFDLDRIQGVIDSLVNSGQENFANVPEGLSPEDLVTNEFIDESIGL